MCWKYLVFQPYLQPHWFCRSCGCSALSIFSCGALYFSSCNLKETFCLLQWSPNDGAKETTHPWGSTVSPGVFCLRDSRKNNLSRWPDAQQETRTRNLKTSEALGLVTGFSVQEKQSNEEKTLGLWPSQVLNTLNFSRFVQSGLSSSFIYNP